MNNSISVTCDKCSEEFPIAMENIVRREVVLYKGEERQDVTLTYFQCPKCGAVYTVMIDTADTLRRMYHLYCGKKPFNSRSQTAVRNHEALKVKRKELLAYWQDATFELDGISCMVKVKHE